MIRCFLALALSTWPSRGYRPVCNFSDVFQLRQNYHSTTSLRHISRYAHQDETLQTAPLKTAEFKGRILVIEDTNLKNHEDSIQSVLSSRCVGFDLEYVPDYYSSIYSSIGDRKRPAVVQIANRDTCLVFLVYKIGHLTDYVTHLLTSDKTLKVCHGAPSDMRLLYRHFGVRARKFVDLQAVSGELKLHSYSLKSVVENVLGLCLSKKHQCSNWEAGTLSDDQVKYAATDAWITLECFIRLKPNKIRRLFVNECGDVEVEDGH